MSGYERQADQRLFDELLFGMWVARAPRGEVLYANRAFRTIVGMDAMPGADIATATAAYGVHDRQGNSYPPERLAFSRAVASGEPVMVDDLVIHRCDGSRVWVRASANPICDEQGAVSHVVIAFTDITAEVRAIVERAEIEKHLEVAIQHAPVLLFMMDRDAVLTAADGALRPVLERGGGGMVGRSLLEAYKDHPTVPTNIRRALAGETVSYSIEVLGLNLDVWLGPVRDAAGELTGAIGVCTDVTESRRLQRRIIQDDRVRAMGTLAASVAHEINNPLTYVLASLEAAKIELDRVLKELGGLAQPSQGNALTLAALGSIERLREHLTPALQGTERIRQVTRELSSFTRRDDDSLTPIDIAAVAHSVLKLLRKEIEARATLVEEIGASPLVLANEARVVQVLINLLTNAWQALPTADPARHVIGVRTAAQGGYALLEVWDTGTGVPEELREQIFEPFVTTKDVGAGSGLGLFVCRNIVDSLDGQISVHDAPGGGALFRVILPATHQVSEAPPPIPTIEAAPEPKARRPRILIIDDDAKVAGALAARVAGDLFEVRTVLDAREGLGILLSDDRFDLAYCDVMMKDFTGMDLYQALEQQAPERLSKVVFMTGGAFTGPAQAFLEQRAGAHVQKPFDIVADAHRRLG